jgi:integrase
MGLELKKGRDGQLVMTWYGRYTENGKRVSTALCDANGTPPASLSIRDKGDTKFEASREKAEGLLTNHQREASQKGHANHLTERLIEAKTGRKVEYVKLADLPARWRGLGRETQPTPSWLAWCDTVFGRFAESVPCEFLHEVTPEQVKAYVEGLRAGYTRRTANGAASLLKSAFERLLPPGASNPFGNEIARKGEEAEGETIHRRPLTIPELTALFETARPDPFLYPLTVCAACTGLRIGDVCLLGWKSVDLRAGVVAVRTAKTGASVEIPIFKPLREVFETALADKGESPYVWPDAARMYKANRYGITYRGKSLFARALADTVKDAPEAPALALERADLAETFPQVSEAVRGAGFDTAKRDRILDSLARCARGESYRRIEAETGRCRGQTSQDLKEAESVSGLRLRYGTPTASKRDLKTLIAATRQKRWEGEKRGEGEKRLSASLLGWHALRGTWATLALSAGIPIETVKLVTGHGTANTVLKYYYNPQRDHLRAVLGDKLPDVLTGGKATKGKGKRAAALPEADPVATMAAQLQSMTPADRARLAALLK